MGKFDKTIQGLRNDIASALESLADIKGGNRTTYVNGKDMTGWWETKFKEIIRKSAELIKGYEKRND
jgi:hypothetical protein